MEFDEINFSYLYQASLNGGKPVTDFEERQYWAQKICKVKESEEDTDVCD